MWLINLLCFFLSCCLLSFLVLVSSFLLASPGLFLRVSLRVSLLFVFCGLSSFALLLLFWFLLSPACVSLLGSLLFLFVCSLLVSLLVLSFLLLLLFSCGYSPSAVFSFSPSRSSVSSAAFCSSLLCLSLSVSLPATSSWPPLLRKPASCDRPLSSVWAYYPSVALISLHCAAPPVCYDRRCSV